MESQVAPVTFRHAGLTVSDLDRSLRFWRDALGLEEIVRQEQRGGYIESITCEPGAHVRQAHLRFPGTSVVLELLQYVVPEGRPVRLAPRDPGGGHIAVTCVDLGAVLVLLEHAGGKRFANPTIVDEGVNAGAVAVYLRDPDQHILELVQPA